MASLAGNNCIAVRRPACGDLQRLSFVLDKTGLSSATCAVNFKPGWSWEGSRLLKCHRRGGRQQHGKGFSAKRIAVSAKEDVSGGSVGIVASDKENVVATSEEPTTSAGGGGDEDIAASAITPGLAAIYSQCRTWQWRGYGINYVAVGQGPPLLLVHGFGASIGHFRRNIPVLSEKYTVFAIDLLGLGASEKPDGFVYTMETWGELLVDFLREVVNEPAVLLGNSIGSLACLITAAEAGEGQVKGTILVNCAGGMNNKAIVDDWRLRLALPLFWLIDFLLLRPRIASSLFRSFRSAANIRNVLESVYSNKEAVDDELLEVILKPSDDPGALHCFVSVITGPPGPRPEMLVPKIPSPILLLWGDEDPFTPMDGPVGKYFRSLPETSPSVEFKILEKCGHCPHDDRPDIVNKEILSWLESVYSDV